MAAHGVGGGRDPADRRMLANERPVVTVVIPTYNRRFVAQSAIESVLAQTFQDIEVIVVDDGSRDNTLEFVCSINDARLRVVRHPLNRGAAAARNTGIENSRGKYIAFLDCDDTWLPTKLEKQVAYLEAQGGAIRACCTGFTYVMPSGHPVMRQPPPVLDHASFFLGCRCAPGSTMMVEATLFTEAGLFDERLRRLEDWDWLLRSSEVSPVGVLQEPLSVVNVAPSRRDLYPVVREAADRLEAKWRNGETKLASARARRSLVGTLHNELAVVAYVDDRFGLALGQLAVSMYYLPRRGPDFFRRIGRRVASDVRRKLRLATERRPAYVDISDEQCSPKVAE